MVEMKLIYWDQSFYNFLIIFLEKSEYFNFVTQLVADLEQNNKPPMMIRVEMYSSFSNYNFVDFR